MKHIVKKIFRRKINYYEKEARIDKKFKRESIIIHHYCPHTFNAGDHFVIQSIRKNLRKYLPNAIFIPKPCAINRGWGSPFYLQKENIGFSNKYADAVIVGGSDNYKNWSLRIDGKEIQRLRPPLFLVGLGVASNDLDEQPLIEKEKYLEDIRKTNEKALVSTVRDEASLNFLKSIGVTKAILTGCPSLYLEDNEKLHFNKDSYIILTFPFPVNRKKLSQRYKKLYTIISQIMKYFNNKKIVISCHDDRDVPIASELFRQNQIFFSNYVEDYYELYRKAFMVVGSRLHGTLLSASLGTPFLNINVDLRGQSFTKTFSLEDWNLNYNENNINEKIISRIEKVLSGDLSPFDKFLRVKNRMKEVFDESMKKIADEINHRISNE